MKILKHTICIIAFIVSCFVLSNDILVAGEVAKNFDNYRFNPFQFPYPEYHYKAEIVPISSLNKGLVDSIRINCFGIDISLPKNFNTKLNQESNSCIVIRSRNNNGLIINRENDKLMGCADKNEKNNNKDFCSSFTSTKDFYYKLFTLTPNDLSNDKYMSKGYAWLVHRKGWMFYQVSNIMIYKGANWVVYRMDFKNLDMSVKTELVIFPESLKPDYLTIGMNFTDNDIINTMISSLQ